MKLPEQQHTTTSAIVRWYESKPQEHRPHLGASILGHKCKRYIWQTWRWVATPTFPGRVLRLFDTGNREEARFVAELRGIGATVWEINPENGKQWSVTFANGHGGGHLDGVAQGLPESPKTPCVLEFKTHGNKSFLVLAAKKVKEAKPQHYDQMQIYMGLMELDRALYLACNKDTDEVYSEWVHFDEARFAELMALAEELIASTEPPARLSDDPAHWECKFCNFNAVCHADKVAEVNCRTCCHSSPIADGKWSCERQQPEIATQKGCGQHLMIPALIPYATPEDGGESYVEYVTRDGARFTNGPAGTAVGDLVNLTSAELQLAPAAIVADAVKLKKDLAVFEPTISDPFADFVGDDPDTIPVKAEAPEKKRARKANAAFVAAMKDFK
jgi:hypothetical protein